MAKRAGAGAVKFQKRDIEAVYSQEMLDSPRESPWGTTQRDQKEGLEFSREEYDEIDAYCKRSGIPWFASCWDLKSLNFMDAYDPPFHKIASPMLTNLDFLEAVASRGKHTFISTGMSTYEEIGAAVRIFNWAGCSYDLMHCVSMYPCADQLCNLNMIKMLRKRYSAARYIGYSGHEVGIIPSMVAVVLGAKVLERHITLDRSMYGSDQSASLEEPGLRRLIDYAKQALESLGDGEKRILDGELTNAKKMRWFK